MSSIHSHQRASHPASQRLSLPLHKFSLDCLGGGKLRTLKEKAAESIATLRDEYKEPGTIGKELALFGGYLVAGCNDAAPGAVLPSIQEHYGINYVTVSMVFIANLGGWLLAAVLCPYITDKFGFGKAISFFAILGVVPYAVFMPLPPFGVFATCFVLSGLSVGSQDSLANTWMASRPRSNLRLGFLHFVYGVGALITPLCAAPFNEASFSFSYFYAIPMGLAIFNFSLVTAAWRWRREEPHADDQIAKANTHAGESHELATLSHTGPASGQVTPAYELKRTPFDEDVRADNFATEAQSTSSPLPGTGAGAGDQVQELPTKDKFRAVFRCRESYIIAAFALFYVGCEVACGGWTSSFLLAKDPTLSKSDANALISGFWAGIAAGRVLLIPVTALLGSSMAVFVYLAVAIGLQLVVWLVPQLIAQGIALAIMGTALGPLFPIMVETAARKIRPRALHTTAIAFIVSFGSAGSALMPFIVGLIAQARGIEVLAPILVALLAAQAFCWALLGDPRKKANMEDRTD